MLERIKTIYIIRKGKNDFGVRTNRFSNGALERIMVENRGSTVVKYDELGLVHFRPKIDWT